VDGHHQTSPAPLTSAYPRRATSKVRGVLSAVCVGFARFVGGCWWRGAREISWSLKVTKLTWLVVGLTP
jgi:hypothetical protein